MLQIFAFGQGLPASRSASLIARMLAAASLIPLLLIAPAAFSASPTPRIGILVPNERPRGPAAELVNRLKLITTAGGQPVAVEVRDFGGHAERLPELVADLVRMKVSVIVAFTNTPAFVARNATNSIPIVVWAAHDAVGTGLAKSLARPGGNVTGTESLAPELDAKRIELIRQIVPNLRVLDVLYNPADPGSPIHMALARKHAGDLGFQIAPIEVRGESDFAPALASAEGRRADALLTLTDSVTGANWRSVAQFASKTATPTICEFAFLVEFGCLVSYGPNFAEFNERVAQQVDHIINHGAKPADLPFEQPTRFELVVNMNTARALGVKIPQTLLLQATRIIE